MADPGVTFDERTGQRILKAVRFVESILRGGGAGRGRWPVGGGGGGSIPVQLPATAIAGRNTSTGVYSSGLGKFYTDTGTALVPGTDTVTVWNPYKGATPAGSLLAWCDWWNGKLWVKTVEC